jgi:RNA polymerase sigma-70 factor (ECF subfamily)
MIPEIEHLEKNIVPMRRKLMKTALKYLQRREDAEDAVQEALLSLWRARSRLNSVLTPEVFATRRIYDICCHKLMRRKETVLPDDRNLGHSLDTPYTQLELHDAVERAVRIIDSLPRTMRTVIRMRDVEGYELDDIAAITEANISAVRVNLARARKRVRDALVKADNYIGL